MASVVQAVEFVASIIGGLIVLYVAARLVALAWHKTKDEYERKLLKYKGDHHGSKAQKDYEDQH